MYDMDLSNVMVGSKLKSQRPDEPHKHHFKICTKNPTTSPIPSPPLEATCQNDPPHTDNPTAPSPLPSLPSLFWFILFFVSFWFRQMTKNDETDSRDDWAPQGVFQFEFLSQYIYIYIYI